MFGDLGHSDNNVLLLDLFNGEGVWHDSDFFAAGGFLVRNTEILSLSLDDCFVALAKDISVSVLEVVVSSMFVSLIIVADDFPNASD